MPPSLGGNPQRQRLVLHHVQRRIPRHAPRLDVVRIGLDGHPEPRHHLYDLVLRQVPIDFRGTDMGIDPPPRIKRLRFVVAMAAAKMAAFPVNVAVVVVAVVQMMEIHVHAAVEITVRLMHHRARDILLGIAQKHGEKVSTHERLRHPVGTYPHEQPCECRQSHQQTVWEQTFHSRLRLKRKRAASKSRAE